MTIAFQASIDICWNVKCTVTLFLMKDAEEGSSVLGLCAVNKITLFSVPFLLIGGAYLLGTQMSTETFQVD